MKRIILFFVLLFMPGLISAQTRENELNISISEPIETLKQARGWSKSINIGDWIGGENKIMNPEAHAVALDNFQNIEVRNVLCNGVEYTLLLKYYMSGHYKYPSIKEGYTVTRHTQGYIIDRDKYFAAIRDMKTENVGVIHIPVLSEFNNMDGVHTLDKTLRYVMKDDVLRDKINNPYVGIADERKNYTDKFLIIQFKKEPTGVTRFLLYGKECFDERRKEQAVYDRMNERDLQNGKRVSKSTLKFQEERLAFYGQKISYSGFASRISEGSPVYKALSDGSIFNFIYYEVNSAEIE